MKPGQSTRPYAGPGVAARSSAGLAISASATRLALTVTTLLSSERHWQANLDANPRRPYAQCGEMFQPKNRRHRFCSMPFNERWHNCTGRRRGEVARRRPSLLIRQCDWWLDAALRWLLVSTTTMSLKAWIDSLFDSPSLRKDADYSKEITPQVRTGVSLIYRDLIYAEENRQTAQEWMRDVQMDMTHLHHGMLDFLRDHHHPLRTSSTFSSRAARAVKPFWTSLKSVSDHETTLGELGTTL